MRPCLTAVLVALAALLCLVVAPAAQANDLVDVGSAIGEFVTDTFTEPDGISTELILGDQANAAAITLSSGEYDLRAKLLGIRSMYFAHEIGVTINVAGSEAPRFQPVLGLSTRLTNIKGTELRIGVRAVSADISERKLESPPWWPGFLPAFEIPYAWVAELRRPIGG